MKVPLEWLKDYVTIRQSPKRLADQLTMAGLEVTGLESIDGEPVFDIEITPNRADCLSIIGVAREVAAITGQRLNIRRKRGDPVTQWPSGRVTDHERPAASPLGERATSGFAARRASDERRSQAQRFKIQIEDRKLCPRYVGRLIEGVTIGSSPDWMQRRLRACRIRAINDVVDITNYVLLEYGQPLHAFDFDSLAEGTLIVRRAQAAESLTTLDGLSRRLQPTTLVIADAKKPVAIAGVMGGQGSEVTEKTTNVLLESALFDPISIRRTAKNFSLMTESSYRFERGVDPVGVEMASLRASALIQTLAGGSEGILKDVGSKPTRKTSILLDVDRCNRWIGTKLTPVEARTKLAQLSCRVASSGTSAILHVSAPSFRRDLTTPVDLYEELARLVGYDHIPSTLPNGPIAAKTSAGHMRHTRVEDLRRLCVSLGLVETINWALVSGQDLERWGIAVDDAVHLANPLSQDHAFLRPHLMVGLLQALRRNLAQGASGVRFFELGHILDPRVSTQESLRLGIALSGLWASDWRTKERGDFFRLKGILQGLAERSGAKAPEAFPTTSAPWLEPQEAADLRVQGIAVGVMGQVAQSICRALDLEEGVWAAELSVEWLLDAQDIKKPIDVPSPFPPVKRDLSIVVRDDQEMSLIERAIREIGGSVLKRLELSDRYVGKQIPSGSHSLTFSLEYRDSNRTLTAQEVDVQHLRVIQHLRDRLGAHLR